MKANVQLVRDDPRQSRLAKPRRTSEQQVIGSLATLPGCAQNDVEPFLQLRLSDEFVEATRSQTAFGMVVVIVGPSVDDRIPTSSIC
jgi:hypothetical protein